MTNHYIRLPKGSIMKWNRRSRWDALYDDSDDNDYSSSDGHHGITEHNRKELNVSVERIENMNRMADGTMRKYVIADKRKWTTSWSEVPDDRTKTVDGKWGGEDIESFYNSYPGAFTLTIDSGTGPEKYTVMFTSFSKVIVKRGRYHGWNVDVELTEV
jgi:hypothetical protein